MPSRNRRKINARGSVRLTTIVFLNLLMMASLLGLAPAAMAAEPVAPSDKPAESPKASDAPSSGEQGAAGSPAPAIRYPDLPTDAPGEPPTMAPPADNKKPAPLPAGLADIDAKKARPAITNPGAGDELTEKRTATSKTFAGTKPGEFKTEIHSEPVHFKDSTGKWKDIDTSLAPVKDGVRKNKSNAFDLELAETAGGEALATVSLDSSHSVGFALEGAAKVKATATKYGVT